VPYLTTRDGVRLFYDETGHGSPVVFSHAFLGRADVWAGQRIALAPRFRVIAYDARGHGRSSAPEDPRAYGLSPAVADLIAVLDELSIDRAHLCGLSMGGETVLHALLDHPDRVASAVLADVGMGMDDREWLAEWTTRVASSFLEQGSVSTFDHHLAASPLVEGLGRRRARAVAGMREIVASQKAHAMAYTLREVMAGRPTVYALEARLRAVQRPVLVLWGAEDPLVGGPSRFLASTIPGARSVVIAGASHVTNIQAPAEFNRALAEFFDPLPPTS